MRVASLLYIFALEKCFNSVLFIGFVDFLKGRIGSVYYNQIENLLSLNVLLC